MKESSVTNFGLLIAFLLPGFVALWGVSYLSETVRSWFGAAPADAPSVGGFLYVTLASVAAGLAANMIRWAIVDTIHHWTGLHRPDWDFSSLQANDEAYHTLNELFFRYHQAYGNTAVAIVFTIILRHMAGPSTALRLDATDAAAVALAIVFFVGSRDALQKFYRRGEQLFAKREPSKRRSLR
jgi:hypothetical protein